MPERSRVVQAGEVRSGRIESLRAVAAIGVLAFHAFASAGVTSGVLARGAVGGSLGVFLFFALTGYLLSWPFLRNAAGEGEPVKFGLYARNRALRILPLYYAVLVVVLVARNGSATEWWRFATFTQSFFAGTAYDTNVNVPMWSVAVELQFYVLLPFLALALAAVAARSRRAAIALLAGAGIASAAIWWLKARGAVSTDYRWRYSLATNFCFFTPGIALAFLRLESQRRRVSSLPPADALFVAGVALWIAAALLHPDGDLLVAVASFFVLGAVVLPARPGVLPRLLDARPLVAVGVVSYSLYLWHWPLAQSLTRDVKLSGVAVFVAAVLLSVAVAFASYAAIERPFLRLRRRWGSTVSSQLEERDERADVAIAPSSSSGA